MADQFVYLFTATDLSAKQRYYIERLNGDWAIRDRIGDNHELYTHPYQGIETLAEAKEILDRIIRGVPDDSDDD
jgi:hypothetical protein